MMLNSFTLANCQQGLSRSLLLVLLALLAMACRSQQVADPQPHDLAARLEQQLPILVENHVFEDPIDLMEWLPAQMIGPSLSHVSVPVGVTFRGCTFRQPFRAFRQEKDQATVSSFFSNLTFLDCIFEDTLSFRGARVYGPVNFVGSEFRALASFEGLNCQQDVAFTDCVFGGEARFQNAVFLQQANFLRAEFRALASFQQVLCHGELQMGAVKFLQYADLSLLDCRGNAFFNYVEFFERATFGHARFQQDASFLTVAHGRTSFDHCRFMGTVRHFKSTAREKLSFRETFFLMGTPDLSFIPADRIIMEPIE